MPSLPDLASPLIVLFASLSLLLTAGITFLAFAYFQLNRKLEALQIGTNAKSRDAERAAAEQLAQAHVKADKILSSTQQQAQRMMASSDFMAALTDQDLREGMTKITRQQLEMFSRALDDSRTDMTSAMTELTTKIRAEMVEELAHFRSGLEKQTNLAEEQLGNQLRTHQAGLQKAMDAYRQDMEARLNRAVDEIISEVMVKVIRKNLSPTDQAQLVHQALEEAKKTRLF